MGLVVYELCDVVTLGEAWDFFLFVLRDASGQVVSDARVKDRVVDVG